MRMILFLFACACSPSPSLSPSPPLSPSPLPLPSPPPSPSRVALSDPACDALALPSPHGTLTIPDAVFAPASASVVRAVCSCTRSGEATHLTATFSTSEGTVIVHAGTPSIDACLQNTIISHYRPFDLGSDCVDCGPHRFGLFHGEMHEVPAKPSSSFTYAVVFAHP